MSAQEALARVMVTETTTLGVRCTRCDRLSVQREMRAVATAYGNVHVKLGLLGDKVVNMHPEYDDCCKIAVESGLPLKEVFQAVEASVYADTATSRTGIVL